jgi:hypothetical protein
MLVQLALSFAAIGGFLIYAWHMMEGVELKGAVK